jgi:heterodisulfide reductase subunit A
MYATKQAMISKDRDPDFEGTVFYMDVRTVGKDYERYYEQAKNRYGIRYIRCAVSTVKELKRSNRMLITYMADNGKLAEEEFDMVVLSLGFSAPENIRQDAKKLGIELDEHSFCRTPEFGPTETSVPGIFVAGAFREPTDIPETVVQASSAAAGVSELLDDFGKKPLLSIARTEPDPSNDEEPLRIGVFLCDNGGMLAQGLDPEVAVAGIKDEDDVVCVETIDVSVLSRATDQIRRVVEEQNLNRIVLAGHKGMALRRALNKTPDGNESAALVECANIGEQCADVHSDRATATAKAQMLVRAGIRKARSAARSGGRTSLNTRVLVVGGGIAGMSSSLSLAEQGMKVTLVEKTEVLGGNALKATDTLKGGDIPALLKDTVKEVEARQEIEVLKRCELKALEGTWGDFSAKLAVQEDDGTVLEKDLTCGAVIFATGGHEIETDEYLYGQDDRIVTQRQLDAMLAGAKPENVKAVVMIQCVGSRDEKRPYCSRVCCGHAVKNSLKLKKEYPDSDVYVLNRDVRTCGSAEQKYHEARSQGVLFVRYDPSAKPVVSKDNGKLKVAFADSVTGEDIEMDADLVVLSTGIAPDENNALLAAKAGIEVNDDGFFAEANPKAAPLDAVARGKYFCGICHSPNHIEDVLCQAKAAAARAAVLLWQGYGEQADNQAYVNIRRCSGCGLCVTACPYDARIIDAISNNALVREALCKGCGTCVISCPNGASQQYDFERATMMEVMDEILD